MEPIEPGSNPPQGPETVEIPENWPGLWADLASVKALADMAMGHPQTSRLAMATAALCQVTENLAQRVEALESPKPCEGCGEQEIKPDGNAVMVQNIAGTEPGGRVFRAWVDKVFGGNY